MNGNRELIILLCSLSVVCHAAWGAVSGLLFGVPAAAVWLAILQAVAVNLFVLWSGSRVRHWLAGVLAPAVFGVAIFTAIRGRVLPNSLMAFGIAIVLAHAALFVLTGGFRRSVPPNRQPDPSKPSP